MENKIKKLINKVDEIKNAENLRDSYENVHKLCDELKSMLEMLI